MKNVSTEFKRQLHYGSKKYLSFADITLEDDTVINLTNAEIFMGGFSCEQAISSDNTFSALGSVIIGSASLIINNISGAYTQYDFTNATVVMQVGLTVNGVVEKVRLGTYRVDDAVYTESSIKLSMLDYMEQFDRPYTTNIQYPTTLNTILRDICTQCGVALATPDFPHKSFSVSTMPLDNGTTFREVVSWIASIAGCYAFCNDSGQLVLDWFDTSVLNQSIDLTVPQPDVNNLGYHYIHNLKSVQTIGIDDTVITGVSISVENENDPAELGIFENNEGTHVVTLNVQDNVTTYTVGTEGYIIHIEGNDFITHSNVIEIINWLATQLIGLQFRKLSVQILSNPTIEVGDVAKVVDRKGNTYNSLITRSYFSVGSYQDIVCGADTPLKNSATRYSSATKSFLKSKKLLKSEQTLREQQIENLTNQLAVKSGMYTTIEASSGGGNIYYMHNKPTLAESSVVWKMTSSAWGVTTDYDHENPEDTVWNGGMTVDGDTITRILSAVGVNADWIETGEFSVTDSQNNETFYVNCDTGVVRINATSFSLTGSTVQQIAQEAVDNIKVGGRNLLLDTATPHSSRTDDAQYIANYTMSDYGKSLFNNTETEFTLSFDYEIHGDYSSASSTSRIYAMINATSCNPANPIYIKDAPRTGHYVTTCKMTAAQVSAGTGVCRVRWNGIVSGCTYTITNYKAEIGNTETDWTPAPEDIAGNVAQITDDLENLSVGGKNLILDGNFTNDFAKWDSLQSQSGAILPEITTEDGIKCCHYQGTVGKYAQRRQNIFARIANDEAGQLYTLSFDMKLVNYTPGETNPYLKVYFTGSYDDNGTSKALYAQYSKEDPDLSVYDGQGWMRAVISNIYFKQKPTNMWFTIYSRDWSGDLYFTNLKLERGNKATDFTLAPEDVQADIDTATATANAANTTAQQANATAQQALDIASSAGGLVAYLDNDYQSVPTDADGNYVTFPECSSKITVFYNSNDVSAQCTYATAVTSGVTGTWNNSTRTYTVTGLTADSGTVTITATYDNKSLSKKFTVIKVRQGISGTNGTNGQNGRSISSMEEYYAISASNSTAPTSWSVNVVAPTESLPYLWNFNRIVYDDNTQEDSQPRVIGNYARNGTDGQNGQNGRGISSITEHYGLSNSTTTEPTSWSDTMQVPTSSAKYLWNYETIVYTDNTSVNTTKRIIGNYASNGAGAYNYELILSDAAIVRDGEGNITPSTITMTAKRNQGTGSPGNYAGRFKIETTTNGTTYTTAYTSSANEATHTYTPTGNEKNIRVSLYLAGGTSTLLDSQNVPVISDGVDGVSPTMTSSKSGGVTTVTITDVNGTRSLTINDGTAGASIATVTNYYLASASATGVTTSTSGWTTNPTASGATISASKPYLWNYEVSKDNNNVTIATTSPAIIGHFGTNGKGISSIEEYYALHSGTSAPSDSRFTTDIQTPTSELRYLWNYEKTTYTDGTYTTTAKHIIGVYGDPGTDAYTVILSNESHTFAGTGGHAIASSVDCNIIAYKGATRVAATIGTITGTITNKLSVTKTNDGTTTAKITVSATNTLDTQSGVLTIPITVDGKSFTKTFSWSVAYNGTDGTATRSYFLDVTPKTVKIGENLAYTPNSITVNSYYRDGDSATNTSYTGYMYIESCKNNTWSSIQNCNFTASTFTITLEYTANENPSYNINTAVLSLPATLSAIRIRLKPSLNSTTILDQQDVILLVDISSLTQATVFNKLTNNGVNKGIYLEGNDLYVNASYIKSGTLILGGSNNVRGTLKVLAENGSTEYVKLNYDGITAIKGEIGGWTIDDHSIRRDKSDSTGSNKINTLIQCPSGSTSTVLAIGATWDSTGGPNGTGATDWTTAPFRVTALGKLYATGAEISGKITATSGKIGGWDITTNSLRNETEGSSNNILIGSTTNNVLSIGATWTSGASATDWATGKFRVTKDGSMYANAGYIGNWKITTNSIRREEKDGADALFLCPTGTTSTVLSIGAPTVSNSVKWTQAPFYVKGNGKLYATGASINGTFESKDGNESIKIVNGIIYGYSGSSECGLIDMSALYGGSSRNVSVYGYKELHLQCGSRISFEANGVEKAWFDSKGLHDSYGFSGSFYVATGYGSDGLPTGWFRLNVKNGIIKD